MKKWTKEEEEYLSDKWGTFSIPSIAKQLGRTATSVKVKAVRLGLGAVLMGGEYVTLNQLLIAFTGSDCAYSYKMKSWVEKRGLPVHTKKVNKNSFRVVYLDEFWEWAKKHRSFLDFSKMDVLALGEEPSWLTEQRKIDYVSFPVQRKERWTEEEDSRLIMLLRQHKYSYAELSEMLHRSAGAIQCRCNHLGIKERPVKADNHGKHAKWTESDFQALVAGIKQGDSYASIGRAVHRSEKAVRGKVYSAYLTEDLDKVRSMVADGEWGSGAPAPTTKHRSAAFRGD